MGPTERREKIAQMSKTVFQYCLSRTSSYQESEDLSQEILLTLCECIDNLRDERAFYAFVWRTADNILRGWYRRKSRLSTSELDESLSDNSWERLEEQAQENEQLSLITRELIHLNSSYRRVMVAYYIGGMSVKDISAHFSLTQSMVKYLLFQSRKRIKEGINMERNFGKYSYDPVHLDWRWLHSSKDYSGILPLSSIKQNLLMACYYDKQNEEQLSLQLGVPTAYLEDEIKALVKHELMTEKNGFYQTNVFIYTKREITERFRTKAPALKETAEKIKSFFADNEEKIRSIGFYGCDSPVNSLKWLVLTRLNTFVYACQLDDILSANFPKAETGAFARVRLIEQEEAPNGDNFDPLFDYKKTEYGHIIYHWIRFNTQKFHRLTDVQASVLTILASRQPETDHDKMVCSELISMDCAVKSGNEIKPNFLCFTSEQNTAFCDILQPFVDQLVQSALDRVEITKKVTLEHTPERFQQYVGDMMICPMYEEISSITRLLVEDNWIVPWSGMNPTNIILT